MEEILTYWKLVPVSWHPYLAGGCVLLVGSVFLWLRRPRKKTNYSARRADQHTLSGNQKHVFAQAQAMIRSGNVVGGAKLLESIGSHREAITHLEKEGYIKEAAGILLRLHRPNRAAHLYAQNGKYHEAADCFELAKMPLEVARCAREYGDWERAAKNFILANQNREAAACFDKLGNVRLAARHYVLANDDEEAIRCYRDLLNKNINLETLKLDEVEMSALRRYLSESRLDTPSVDRVLGQTNILDMLIEMVKKGKIKEATDLYLRCTTDVGPQLLAIQDLKQEENNHLADLFTLVSNFEYAGIVYERMNDFQKAGDAFARSEDFERAQYCYERGNIEHKVDEMRAKLQTSKPHRAANKNAASKFAAKTERLNPFFMNETNVESNLDSLQANEATVMVEAGDFGLHTVNPATGLLELAPLHADENRVPFHKASFIEDLDYRQKNQIWEIGTPRRYETGKVILDFKADPEGVYFILSGKVTCYKMIQNRETKADSMEPPVTFGEFWLLVDYPSQVKFVAETSCEILVVERDRFNELLDKNGTIARKLYKRFTQRLLNKMLTPQSSDQTRKVS